jgi:hypothetical protein
MEMGHKEALVEKRVEFRGCAAIPQPSINGLRHDPHQVPPFQTPKYHPCFVGMFLIAAIAATCSFHFLV